MSDTFKSLKQILKEEVLDDLNLHSIDEKYRNKVVNSIDYVISNFDTHIHDSYVETIPVDELRHKLTGDTE